MGVALKRQKAKVPGGLVVKDLALSLLWLQSLLWLGLNPWPRNFHMPRVQQIHPPPKKTQIVKSWKQSKFPSVDKRIKKMWYIHTMEYYSAVKRNDLLIPNNVNDVQITKLSGTKFIPYDFIYIKC